MKSLARILVLTTALASLLQSPSTARPQEEWIKVVGGSGFDWGSSIVSTNDGGYISVGYTLSNDGDFEGMNKGVFDALVVKLDSTGQIQWKRTFGGSGDDRGYSVTVTDDGSFIVTGNTLSNDGDFEGMNKGLHDIFILKLDRNGDVLWKKTLGGTRNEWSHMVIPSRSGGVVIKGSYSSDDGDFLGKKKDLVNIFVASISADGSIAWMNTYSGNGIDLGSSITQTSDGGFVFTGYTTSATGAGTTTGALSNYSIIVTRLDALGQLVWTKTIDDVRSSLGLSITCSADDNIYLTGYSAQNDAYDDETNKGGEDAFVIKMDYGGNVLWRKSIGGSGDDWGTSITSTTRGDIVLTGSFNSNDQDFKGMIRRTWFREFLGFNGESDIYVARILPDGNLAEMQTFGGTYIDRTTSIAPTKDGGVIAIGSTNSDDGHVLGLDKGDWDIIIVKTRVGTALSTK